MFSEAKKETSSMKRDFARLDKFSDKMEYKYRRKSVDLQW